VHCSAC